MIRVEYCKCLCFSSIEYIFCEWHGLKGIFLQISWNNSLFVSITKYIDDITKTQLPFPCRVGFWMLVKQVNEYLEQSVQAALEVQYDV